MHIPIKADLLSWTIKNKMHSLIKWGILLLLSTKENKTAIKLKLLFYKALLFLEVFVWIYTLQWNESSHRKMNWQKNFTLALFLISIQQVIWNADLQNFWRQNKIIIFLSPGTQTMFILLTVGNLQLLNILLCVSFPVLSFHSFLIPFF